MQIVEKYCVLCGRPSEVELTDTEFHIYTAWIANRQSGGGYIQDVLPFITPGQRETLISGSHEECFDDAFGGDD